MSIEGLGKKFQDARLARGLTLDEAARMTKIRPSRLAEIEADDFSNFPSLAYAKGFLLIYGKFLDVDVSEFMEAFEGSEQVTVDGYSYLQDNPPPKPARPAVVRRSSSSSSSNRTSLIPFLVGVVIIVLGFLFMKFILNILRVAPRAAPEPQAQSTPALPPPPPAPTAMATATPTPVVVATPRPAPSVESTPAQVVAAPTIAPSPTIVATSTPAPTSPAVAIASATPKPQKTAEPEVRRAEPVKPDDLAKATKPETSPAAAAAATATATAVSDGVTHVAIRPLRRTYIKVVVDKEARTPAFERWISPSDGTVEFKGQHIDVRVLDREAVQIRKNGKTVADGDTDVTIE